MDDKTKTLFLAFVRSLSLCDHMGDVENLVDSLLRKLGLEIGMDNTTYEKLEQMGIPFLHEIPK